MPVFMLVFLIKVKEIGQVQCSPMGNDRSPETQHASNQGCGWVWISKVNSATWPSFQLVK